MAHITADRVKESTTTTGTGALTLAGAITGFRAFSAVCATSDTVHYALQAVDGSGVPTGDWEVGLGTYSGANTLTRTTILSSSNSGSAVSLAAGTKHVWIDIAAGPYSSISRYFTSDSVGAASVTSAATKNTTILGGSGSASFDSGGSVNIAGGAGASFGNGGAVNITGGAAGSGGAAGGVTIVGSSGTVSGSVTIKSGDSSNPAATNINSGNSTSFAVAGAINIQPGTSNNAAGGVINISAGAGHGSNQNGGAVVIKGGAPTGTGAAGNVVLNGSGSTLATTATGGFTMIPTCAGTPTGTPASIPTGTVPIVFDTTGVKLWIYTGGAWKGVVVA